MPARDLGVVQEVLRRFWHAPVLQALGPGALRYSQVAAVIGEQTGRRPGDGTVSKALTELCELGLVQRRPLAGTRRHEWALTQDGVHAVNMLRLIGQQSRGKPSPDTVRGDKTSGGRTGRAETKVRSDRTANPSSSDADFAPQFLARIDTTVPHPARRYNYWLGGKDNFAADRESGDKVAELMPTVRLAVRENRKFQTRAVRHLAGPAGIRQFLDIGTGIPAPDNPHEVAQAIDPTCRVAYVDNDPVVLAHSRALLNSTPEGATCYVEADVRDPHKILNDPEVHDTLDFTQPIALLLIAIMHFVDDDEAYRSVETLVKALPSGSYLAISHGTLDHLSPSELAVVQAERASGRHGDTWPRSRDEIARFFTGTDLVPPGIVPLAEWHDDGEPLPRPTAKDISMYGGLARIR